MNKRLSAMRCLFCNAEMVLMEAVQADPTTLPNFEHRTATGIISCLHGWFIPPFRNLRLQSQRNSPSISRSLKPQLLQLHTVSIG